jgi:hypothetical protein
LSVVQVIAAPAEVIDEAKTEEISGGGVGDAAVAVVNVKSGDIAKAALESLDFTR